MTPRKSGKYPSRKILLIEDDALFRRSMTMFIKSMGYEVVAAGSGEEGLQFLAREAIDLMVADYQLPGISGIDVVRAMRHLGIDIPVVLVSAFLDEQAAAEARAEQVNAILTKSLEQLQRLQPTFTSLLQRPV
jgi:CheY-like chemotaxis protein